MGLDTHKAPQTLDGQGQSRGGDVAPGRARVTYRLRYSKQFVIKPEVAKLKYTHTAVDSPHTTQGPFGIRLHALVQASSKALLRFMLSEHLF